MQVDLLRSLEDADQVLDRSVVVEDLQGAGEEPDPFVVERPEVLVEVSVRIGRRVALEVKVEKLVVSEAGPGRDDDGPGLPVGRPAGHSQARHGHRQLDIVGRWPLGHGAGHLDRKTNNVVRYVLCSNVITQQLLN